MTMFKDFIKRHIGYDELEPLEKPDRPFNPYSSFSPELQERLQKISERGQEILQSNKEIVASIKPKCIRCKFLPSGNICTNPKLINDELFFMIPTEKFGCIFYIPKI